MSNVKMVCIPLFWTASVAIGVLGTIGTVRAAQPVATGEAAISVPASSAPLTSSGESAGSASTVPATPPNPEVNAKPTKVVEPASDAATVEQMSKLMPTGLQLESGDDRKPVSDIIKDCTDNHSTTPYCMLRCFAKDIVCVNEAGAAIPSEVIPDRLDPSTTIQVVVITLGVLPKVRLTETLGGSSFIRLTTPQLKDNKALIAHKVGALSYQVATVTYTMAKEATSERIDFISDELVVGSIAIATTGGYYFLSAGAAGIAQFSSTPKIKELTPPAGSGTRYEPTYGNELRLALMLNVHPFGHRAQSLSPFADPPAGIGAKAKTILRDMLSLQAGVNFDPSRLTDSLLLGVGIEPATGITASFGTLFDTGERFHNGYEPGAFATTSREDAVESYLHMSAYFGICINQRVYELITGVYSAFNEQSQF